MEDTMPARLSTLTDDDDFPMTYAEAAKRLGITEQSLRNRLVRYRAGVADHRIPISALVSRNQPHNTLLDRQGVRITHKNAAAGLGISMSLLHKLLWELRRHDHDIRAGAAISWGVLCHHLSTDNQIIRLDELEPRSLAERIAELRKQLGSNS